MFGPSGAVVYSTYLGGSAPDFGNAIAVDSTGAAYVAGSTASSNFPVIAGASQGNFPGSSSSGNAFVAKVANLNAPAVALSPQQVNFGNEALNNPSSPITVTLINAGSAPLEITSIVPGSAFAQKNYCGTMVPGEGGSCTIQITFTPTITGATTDEITITDNAQGSPHVITVTGTGVIAGSSLTIYPKSLTFQPETVNVTSPPQSVYLTNTGLTAVTLTNITITGDYAETNTCGTVPASPYVLNVGNSCTVTITFMPTGSGSRSGSLSITDSALGSPQTVALSGTGNPVFSLSANARSAVTVIGTTSQTFTLSVSAPSSFVNSISFSCSGLPSGATCSSYPSSITAGQTSTLTVTGLSATSPNPLNFTVAGTGGSQTASVALTIFFMDFSLTASPSIISVQSGQSATYTLNITPSNGFNQVVLLTCNNLPQATSCAWNPPGLTLNGVTVSTATVTVGTTVESTRSIPRGPPSGNLPFRPLMGWELVLLWLAVFALLGGCYRICGSTSPSTIRCGVSLTAVSLSQGSRHSSLLQGLRPHLLLAALAMLLSLSVFGGGCQTYSIYPTISPATISGTPVGNYTLTFEGTLGNNSAVTRTTTAILSVGTT
jgi:hypothetical protein